MQVFVNRADLTAIPNPDPFPVVATYADSPWVPINAHGDVATVITLPGTVVQTIKETLAENLVISKRVLNSTWRDNAEGIVNNEAGRRIEDVFPDYKQRNSTATYQQCVTAYGSNTSVWPIEAKTFKDEYDRGWSYVNAVRERTPPLIASMPPDPTANNYWPTRIDPVHFEPVF
jgi:hypothetical protein